MARGDQRHGKEPAAEEEEDKFPEGLRVLAVDDDPVSLRVLQVLLKLCNYNATMVKDARTALNMLRDGGADQFDLVITDVHMPDMDGFKLLELIRLEMNLPVILLSVNEENDTIYKGMEHGACDYIVKPPNINKLRNIWQHVIRKKQVAVNHSSNDHSDDADQRVVRPVIAERENGGAKCKKCSKKKKNNDGDNSDENRESTRVQTTRNKPRVSWGGELHARFLEVVNQLGVDKAVPKTILHMMNVRNLSRGSVGSHLQKFRLHLKRVADQQKKSDSLGDSSQKRNSRCYMDMSHPGQPSSAVCFYGSNNTCAAPSILGPQGLSIQPRNRTMGTYHTMLDALSPSHSDQAYVSVLREKLLEPSSMMPTSHPGNSSFADMPIGGLSEHVNQFPVQPPELIGQFSGPMYTAPSAVSTRRDGQFPYIVGNSRNHWQNAGSSSSPIHMDGAPLSVSQVNIPQMNQLPIFGASSGQMPMLQNEQQNQMEGIFNNNNTQVSNFSEQMTPLFDIASSTGPVEMTHDFSPMTHMMVNGGSTSSPLPNLQTGSYVAPPAHMVNGGSISSAFPDLQDSSVVPPTQMVNGRDASGIPPVQDGPADQPTYSNSNFLEEIVASVVHQDFNPDDAFYGGEY